MKLERLPDYFITVIVVLIGLALALYVGQTSGTGDLRSLVFAIGGVCYLIIGAAMGKHVWLLIPFSLAAEQYIFQLPISVKEAGIITAFGWWIVYSAFKRVSIKRPYEGIDALLVLHVFYVFTMFIRKPVGVNVFANDMIGGRPYMEVIVALMAYWVLSRVPLDEVWARRAPWLTVIGGLPGLFLGVLVRIVPAVSPVTGYVMGIYAAAEAPPSAGSSEADSSHRERLFAGTTRTVMTALFAYFKPSTFINPLYFWRCLAFVIALALIAISGFRNFVGVFGLYFLVIAWYKGNLGPIFRTSLIAVPVAAMVLAAHGTLYTFPFSVQRALSFLPAKWDEAPLRNAEYSSEWRREMWSAILTEKGHVDNIWLGNGFGYSAAGLAKVAFEVKQNPSRSQELFLYTGEVHGGPATSLFFAGIIGGIFYYALAIALAIKAHRLIRRAMNTPFEFYSLFAGVPVVLSPILYTLVFGSYNSACSVIIIQLGVIKMIASGLDRYLKKQKKEAEASEAQPIGLPA